MLWKKKPNTKKTTKQKTKPKSPRFRKAFRSKIPEISVAFTPRFTKIVRSQCPKRGNVLTYSSLSEYYLSWGTGERSILLLAEEIAVYKKPLVGKLPQTTAQMLMIQRCNLNTNIWTQSVAEVHLEEIRLKYQWTWKYNHFTKKKKKKVCKGLKSSFIPQYCHSAGSDTCKPFL